MDKSQIDFFGGGGGKIMAWGMPKELGYWC